MEPIISIAKEHPNSYVIPISALVVLGLTWWMERRREKKFRRLNICQTLLQTRSTPDCKEHVDALNLAQIEFINCKNIKIAWGKYHEHVTRKSEKYVPKNDMQEFEKCMKEAHDRLLHLISREVRIKITLPQISEANFIFRKM